MSVARSRRRRAKPPTFERVKLDIIEAHHDEVGLRQMQACLVVQPCHPECRHAARSRGLDPSRRVFRHETVLGHRMQFLCGEFEDLRVGLAVPQVAPANVGL